MTENKEFRSDESGPIEDGSPYIEPEEEPTVEAPPEGFKRVKIGDREFDLPIEAADKLASVNEERETQFARKLSEQSEELGSLRKRVAEVRPPEVKPDAVARRKQIADLMLVDPGKAVDMLTEDIKSDLRVEYSTASNWEKYWTGFYSSFPKLADSKLYVTSVMNQHIEELKPLSIEASQKRLAELVLESLPTFEGKKADVETLREHKPREFERPNSARGTAPVEETKKRVAPSSISSIISARKKIHNK